MTKQKLFMIVGLFLALGLAMLPSPGTAQAQEICDNGVDDNGDKLVDCDDPLCVNDPACKEPPPPPQGFCHNIGGAEELGANCDQEAGTCTVTEEGTGRTFTISGQEFFGIVIGTDSPQALLAHILHGDGGIVEVIDPPLHLASQGDNHRAANVTCIGLRVIPQPDEPGN
jgi:hypothetical protein